MKFGISLVVRGADANGYRSEFIELVRETRALGLLN